MIIQEQLKDVEGVEHISDDLFRVRLDMIQFAEAKDDTDVLSFRNPRYALGTNSPKGFSKEEMTELRETIRSEGLKNPIQLRWVEIEDDIVLQIVDGERRTRCLQKLVKDNLECYDPSCEDWKFAKTLYETVLCRVNNLDDQGAFKIAFSQNDRAVGIGEGCTVALIRDFRNAGWTDKQIADTTTKSISWIRETDALLGLDDDTFQALAKDQINRRAALDLAQIEDVEERMAVLNDTLRFAQDRLDALKEKLELEVETAEEKAELAEAEAEEANFDGDTDGEAAALAKAEKAKKRAAAKKEQKSKVEAQPVKAKTKDVAKAKAKASGDTEPEPKIALTRNKIQKCYYQPLAAIIKNDGCDEEGESLGIDVEDARLVKLLCESIEKGETDIVRIMVRHNKAKEKRANS